MGISSSLISNTSLDFTLSSLSGKVKIEIKPAKRKVIAATKILNDIFNSFIMMGKNKKLRNNSPIDGCGNSIPNKALDTSERKKYGINTTIRYITKYMAKVIINTS